MSNVNRRHRRTHHRRTRHRRTRHLPSLHHLLRKLRLQDQLQFEMRLLQQRPESGL